jgi:hypothetical protein
MGLRSVDLQLGRRSVDLQMGRGSVDLQIKRTSVDSFWVEFEFWAGLLQDRNEIYSLSNEL